MDSDTLTAFVAGKRRKRAVAALAEVPSGTLTSAGKPGRKFSAQRHSQNSEVLSDHRPPFTANRLSRFMQT
jgi:hypothetical protein